MPGGPAPWLGFPQDPRSREVTAAVSETLILSRFAFPDRLPVMNVKPGLRRPDGLALIKEIRIMNIFIAGGTGAIGIPLVRALVAAGHHVTALTRSAARRNDVLALGASAAVADALDREALMAVVSAARPTHVIHQLTALPPGGPRRARELEPTNRLRIEGTRNPRCADVPQDCVIRWPPRRSSRSVPLC